MDKEKQAVIGNYYISIPGQAAVVDSSPMLHFTSKKESLQDASNSIVESIENDYKVKKPKRETIRAKIV